ncbi:DUF6545 domain-containing protein [Mycobacterium intracellulare]|uniref:DUF6545 domain-containing protein n=1 Tax=Mycobacterium intracellulare TaxID=1767 RepID=UPI001EEE1AC8|nr:DUF6545 domain-containing protein [Mycobacterium intracellulare]MEE3755293.1 DUF6545 domain-containing protein [Mycobacterium intracellulare]
MTTSIPSYITWPLLALMCLMVLMRYMLFNSNPYEGYLNNTVALMVLANFPRERAVEDFLADHHILSVTATQQLSLVLMIFSAAELMGFASLWTQYSPDRARRHQRIYRGTALLLAVGFWIAATPARQAGRTLEEYGGWSEVVSWAFMTAMLLALSARLIYMSITELRHPNAGRLERLICIFVLAIAIAMGVSTGDAVVLSLLEKLGWFHSAGFLIAQHKVNVLGETVSAAFLVSVPAIRAAQAHLGLDSISRRWRRLEPLRAAMIAAVPESSFDLITPESGRQKTSLELHQSTVQIRDAMLLLRPYVTSVDDAAFFDRYKVPAADRVSARQALQLAHAAAARIAGRLPGADIDAVVSRSRTLAEETTELLQIARWWPAAVTDASMSTQSSRTSWATAKGTLS